MGTVAYYLSLPILFGISLLPLRLLYVLSDMLYVLLFRVIGYRHGVITENMRNAFPELQTQEVAIKARRFERYFCDLILETIKTLTMSTTLLRKMVAMDDLEPYASYYQAGQSISVVLGHYGNWELAGARFSQEKLHHLNVIYRPLHNKRFDRLIYRTRTRFGTGLYPAKETVRCMIRDRDKITATAFIADQTPPPKDAYWTTFLNQPTPVYTGTEWLSKKFEQPVVYCSVQRVARGRYRIESEILVSDPTTTSENEISELHTRRLEKDIINDPVIWLWSHRRWKHQPPT